MVPTIAATHGQCNQLYHFAILLPLLSRLSYEVSIAPAKKSSRKSSPLSRPYRIYILFVLLTRKANKYTILALIPLYVSPVELYPLKTSPSNDTASNKADYCLAIVVHSDSHNPSKDNEACLLLVRNSPEQGFPTVVNVLPIASDFKHEISQAKTNPFREGTDLCIEFSGQGQTISVIFKDKDDTKNILADIKNRKNIAVSHGYSPEKNSHAWLDAYTKFASPRTMRKPPMRSNTLPLKGESSIPYVLPVQRQDTVALLNLRRTASTMVKKVRNISTSKAKEHWIFARLMDQEDEFVKWKKANVFVGTWNVHGSNPPESLSTWILGTLTTDAGDHFEPDLYVIGLQEMETNTEAYIRYDPTKETAWVNAVFAAFGEKKSSYYKVASQQLVTMLLIVIAKKEHSQDICEVETNYTGVGLMNMMGNKGGVAVRLRYHDSYFCFITSHLAAFVDKVEKRNQDFTSIAKRLVFRNYPDDILAYLNFSWNSGGDEGVSFLESNGVSRKWTKDASIFHADHLIWLGDLNYRVNLSEAEIKMRLQQGELDYLLEYDQLSIERQAGRTFSMFDEGRIEFTPTYKFDAGTNQYDTSEKRRAPSWTDRILWKKSENEDKPSKKRQNLLSYDSCMKMMTSDHKPVRALFETNVRKINHQKLALTKDKLIKRLVATKDQTPKATLVNSFVKFGDVQFMEFKERSIVLENTGLVLVTFRFKSKLSDIDEYDNSEFDQNKNADQTSEEIIPSWLTVHPTSGVLGPGEKVVIQFELMIDPSISAPFNKREKDIDEVLVLRIKGGGDYFVIVEGKYQPTCFGVPLEDLASMPVPVNPIRYIPLQDSKNHTPVEPSVGDRQAQQVNLPKELWKVLNFLWNKNMLSIESLFLEHGDRVICHYIRQCMDTDSPFDSDILLGKDIKDEKPVSAVPVSNQAEVASNDFTDKDISNIEKAPSSNANPAIETSTSKEVEVSKETPACSELTLVAATPANGITQDSKSTSVTSEAPVDINNDACKEVVAPKVTVLGDDTEVSSIGESSTINETSIDQTYTEASSISEDSSENEESLEKEALGANSMVDVLVAFLECLPEPVIPTNMYKLALEAADSPEAMAILIATIPRIHLNVLHYINDFLRDAMKYAPESCKEYRRQRIVELFSGMIRPPVDFKERNPALAREKREKFVGQLLRT